MPQYATNLDIVQYIYIYISDATIFQIRRLVHLSAPVQARARTLAHLHLPTHSEHPHQRARLTGAYHKSGLGSSPFWSSLLCLELLD